MVDILKSVTLFVLIPLIISVGGGLVTNLVFQQNLSSAVIWGAFLFIATTIIQINVKVDDLLKHTSADKLRSEVIKRKWLVDDLTDLVVNYNIYMKERTNEPAPGFATKLIKTTVRDMKAWALGQVTVNEFDRMEISIDAIKATPKGSIIYAMNFANLLWWQGFGNQYYYPENVAAKNRGIEIRRIFAINRNAPIEEWEAFRKEIGKHVKSNFQVYVIIAEHVPVPLRRNWICIPAINFLSWSIPVDSDIQESVISWSGADIKRYNEHFQLIVAQAECVSITNLFNDVSSLKNAVIK